MTAPNDVAALVERPHVGDEPMSADEKLVERLRGPASEAAARLINHAFGNEGERPRFSIPARPNHDDDLVLLTAILDAASAIEASEAKIAALTAENATLREKVEAVTEGVVQRAVYEGMRFIAQHPRNYDFDPPRWDQALGTMARVKAGEIARAALRQEGKP